MKKKSISYKIRKWFYGKMPKTYKVVIGFWCLILTNIGDYNTAIKLTQEPSNWKKW